MLKWVLYTVMPMAAFGTLICFAAACSNKQPSASSLASGVPAVEIQTATPEPTKAPENTAAPEPTTAAESSESVSETAADLPRRQTLYFGGRQWGAVKQWNPYSAAGNNGMAVGGNSSARITMFETLYMFNWLDYSMQPLLALGPPVWNEARTELKARMNPNAKWSDGTPVTAQDVVYTFGAHMKYETAAGVRYKNYIEAVYAPDAFTVVFRAKLNEDGKAVNRFQLEDYICRQYVIQKAWTEKLEARSFSNEAFINDPGDDAVYSGPYHNFYSDGKKVVMIRDDNYWGKKLWGRLPVPKYLAHVIYGDSAETAAAFVGGKIDIDAQYLPNVQDLWEDDKKPDYAYLNRQPYNISTTMPAVWFNLKSYGLDQVAVRKAIAVAVDYDAIVKDAMTGQAPTFADAPPSLMNPSGPEQDLYDHEAVKDLQWTGNDIEGANNLLDEAGMYDVDGDGFREYNGRTLRYNAACPDNRDDFLVAMKAVADVGPKIGIDIELFTVPPDVYQAVVSHGDQADYDIFIMTDGSTGPMYPWLRLRERMSSEFLSQKSNRAGNWAGYKNERADQIIKEILAETDKEKLKALYTEAVKIYLTDVPSFTVMYRPELFYTVNESVWTGFPKAGDSKNIPPTDCTDGYGIAGLYNLKLAR